VSLQQGEGAKKIKEKETNCMGRKSCFFTLALTVISLFVVSQVMAGPSTPASAVKPLSGVVGPMAVVIPGPPGTLVLDISYYVTNDEDSGIFGYWGLDSYTKSLQVWETSPGNFYAEAQYIGTWRTFRGALSPGLGMTQEKDASGNLIGGYTATFTGTFSPGSQKVKGYIGVYNYGGTKADVLLGKYSNGQVGPTNPFAVLTAYFPGYANFAQPSWGWTYSYRDQLWMNFVSANIGDVLSWDIFH